ncbi:MAG: carbohydrate ABC transporter permease [Candidatus Omnitrophica bacterium]|nr:carbohydrate ABC transporter permease [Candidatus Omnitrophota bacterium]MCM8798562.1 carbohydrate ABC transporter permease [Candidatus Omnitrophota bacterium]
MGELIITAEESRRKKRRKEFSRRLMAYILLSFVGVSMVLPFLWMVSTSLKEPEAVFIQLKPWWRNWIPEKIVWANYRNAWKAVPFGRFYFNSIIVAICVTAGVVFTSSFSAYAFSRLNFPGRDKLFFAYIATMMIPGSVVLIPQFALVRILGWIDTYRALIIPAMFTAFGTFLLRQFFMTLPKDLEDAAKIDGCGYFGIYWRIILPLSKPPLATLTTFTFIGNWNSFMWPLLVTNKTELRTLPIGLEYFKSQYTADWSLLMAGSVMVLLPVIILYIFNQRFFVEGVKLTGIKG